MNYEDHMRYHSLEEPDAPKAINTEDQFMLTEAGEFFTLIHDNHSFQILLKFTDMPTGLTRAIMKQHGLTWNELLSAWTKPMGDVCLVDQIEALMHAIGASPDDE